LSSIYRRMMELKAERLRNRIAPEYDDAQTRRLGSPIPVCQPGRHAAELDDTLEGWRMLPAIFHFGQWVYAADSTLRIPVCPEHYLTGEPSQSGS
jgi:hypothetical protein